jgi:hypothetical protein
MRAWMIIGVGAALGPCLGCSGDDDPTPPVAGNGGTGSEVAMAGAGGTAGGVSSAGAGGMGGSNDCSSAATLPNPVEEDLTVGPGCVRIERTRVTGGATLTIAPGTRVLMAPSAFIAVEGSALVSVGTADAPITFTSESSSPLAGDWECIHVDTGSSATEIQFTTLEYGGAACGATGAGYEGMLTLGGAARAVSNNTFRSSSTHGVTFRDGGSVRSFENNAFADNEAPSISIAAPELLALGAGLTFADADDAIEVDTTFSLGTTGTWLAQPVPFSIVGQLNVDDLAEVTIAAGTELRFNGRSFEVFNANLIVAGTEADPVLFTSSQATPQAGDWGCLTFSSVMGTPRFDHAIFEYAGNGAGCSGAGYTTALNVPESAVVTNSTFRQIAGTAIRTNGNCNTAGWCSNVFETVETGPLECGSDPPLACP